MYPVHIMRKFVCDRLTAAAQEILGAFEKRVEDYEEELARQRRLLDRVFSPERKFIRTDTPQIKDEHEEICISQELPQPAHQPEVACQLTPICDPHVSGDPPRPLDPCQSHSVANEDPLSHSSNKNVESGAEGRSSPALLANWEHELLSQISFECEDQNYTTFNDGSATQTRHIEALQEERSFEESAASAANTELPYRMNSCGVKSISTSTRDLWDGIPALLGIAELIPSRESKDERTESTSCTGPTPNVSSLYGRPTSAGSEEPIPDGQSHDEKFALRQSFEMISTEKSQDGRAGEKSNDDSTARQTDLTLSEKSQDGDSTLAGSSEPAPHNKSKDKSSTSTKSTEQTPNQESEKDTAKSAERSDGTQMRKHKDGKITSNESPDPPVKKKFKDAKPSSKGAEKNLHRKRNDDTVRSNREKPQSSASPDDGAPEGSQDPTPDEQTSTSVSNPAQNKRQGDEKADSTGNMEPTQSKTISKKKTDEHSEETPSKKHRDGNNASTSSKPKHQPGDGSPISARSNEMAANKTPDDDEDASLRSKETAFLERQNSRGETSTESSDPIQKRLKDENITPTRTDVEKHDEGSNENETMELSQSMSDGDTSTDGEEEEKEENPFKCDKCGKVMTNFKNYKFHMKSHTIEKTFKCETCGKMFRESWDLNKHSVIHAAEKPYKCDICGNGFNRRYNLDLHVRVHTGEKPYKCSTCSKSFSSCVNMKKHMRIHTGEKPYICSNCGKEFADSSAFKNHMRVHTGEKPFKCTYCKRKFATRTTLKRHTRTHTGEKPYKCSVCDKTFGHRTDLKGHMRMHTGEKPYKCTTCGEQFSTWTKLNKHKRVHSSEAQSSTHEHICI